MYSMKEKEQFGYSDYNNQESYNSNANDIQSDRYERNFDMQNNNSYNRQANYRNDYRYDSAGNMRNNSYQTRNNNVNNSRFSNGGEYSSLNRYYGTPQVRNDIESTNRVVAQNQNTTTVARSSRATENPNYDIYNNKPKVEKKKLSMRVKICILVVCAVIALALSLTVANLIPNASAQSVEQTKQQVTIDENVGKVVDEQGGVSDVALVESGSGYNYDTKTNWFDGFCDWIENLVG